LLCLATLHGGRKKDKTFIRTSKVEEILIGKKKKKNRGKTQKRYI